MSNEISPEETRLRELGKQKKLWRVTIRFTEDYTNETKVYSFDNLTDEMAQKFREKIFKIGFKFCIDPGHYVVISPWNIKELHIFRQEKFFEP